MTIRPAAPGDAAAIAAVHVASWRAAYRDDAPEGWLDTHTLRSRTAAWEAQLRDDGLGRSVTQLAVIEGEVVAFCGVATPSRDRDADEDTAEVATFYVDPARWRAGAGSALMASARDRLGAAGWETLTLWVLETNARARAFYVAHGFAPDGARQTHAGWPPEIRMRRALT